LNSTQNQINMFLSSSSCQEIKRKKERDPYINKVTPATFFSLNEIQISQRIISIPHYASYFAPVIKSSTINIAKIDSNKFEKCEIIDANQHSGQSKSHYLLVTKLYQPDNQDFASIFYDSFHSGKRLLYYVITSYRHLLKSITLLNKAEIVHLNLHPSNIEYSGPQILPVIQTFTHTFHIPSINQERIRFLFSKISHNNAVFLPVEAHIISYLTVNNSTTLSSSQIVFLCEDAESRLTSLSCFTESFINQYKETTHISLQSYINMPREQILSRMLATSHTWNIFGLSILFLVLLRDMTQDEYTRNPFLFAFHNQLIQNIDADFEKRPTSLQNSERFSELLYSIKIAEFQEIESLFKNEK